MRFILIFITLFFSISSQAETEKIPSVVFQADKNGVQILPQKFEYTLLDSEKIRIGDILIDASTFNFQLIKSRSDESYAIKFTWPAGLLTEGQLILMNHNGKAIWQNNITENQIKITRVSSDFPNLRAELAVYNSEKIEADILTQMKYLPFINFCISAAKDNTKIYLCSRELYVSSAGKEIVVSDRKKAEKEAFVEINGNRVGSQGIIVLNDKDQNIFFKATAESGAYLEIETRMKEVDFKDSVLSENGENLILTAFGAEPVDSSKVKFIAGNSWKIEVPVNRPIIYLKGGGGIPMRQEFFIKGDLPPESLRPKVLSDSVNKTFSSTISLKGSAPQGVRLRPASSKETLQVDPKNNFTWEISDLPRGEISRRYLNLTSKSKTFVARYDIYHGRPYVLQTGLQYQTPSGVAIASLQLQWWLEKFITSFQWGLQLNTNIQATKNAGYPEYNETRLEILYRFQPGFPLQENYWGLGLPISSITGKDVSTTAFGISFWGYQNSEAFFPSWIKAYQPKFSYLSGSGTSGNFKLSSWLEFENLFITPIKNNHWLTYGLHYRILTWDPVPTEGKNQIVFNVGYLINF